MKNEIGEQQFATYVRGTKRIDYALATEWIQNAFISGCYTPFGDYSNGDHRNIFLNFDVIKLFGTVTQPLDKFATREFTTQDKQSVRTYIEKNIST